jgi:DNA-binding GntR family transcriptional regulator
MMRRLEAQHRRILDCAQAGQTSEWRDHDWRFHEMVCRMAGNEFLLRFWLSISTLVRLFLHRHPAFERASGEVIGNHERMVAALRAGDADQADAAFRSAILSSGLRRLGMEPPAELARLVAGGPRAAVADTGAERPYQPEDR